MIFDDAKYNAIAREILAIILLPFALLIDSFVFALLGGTLGKYLFGIQIVTQSSKKISAGKYFYRNFLFYFSGMGLAIPIISLYTFSKQYGLVSKDAPASYDETLHMKSVRYNQRWYKTLIGIIVLMLFFVLLAIERFQ